MSFIGSFSSFLGSISVLIGSYRFNAVICRLTFGPNIQQQGKLYLFRICSFPHSSLKSGGYNYFNGLEKNADSHYTRAKRLPEHFRESLTFLPATDILDFIFRQRCEFRNFSH